MLCLLTAKHGSALISLQFPTESLNALTSPRLLTLILFRNSKFTLPQIDSILLSVCIPRLPLACPNTCSLIPVYKLFCFVLYSCLFVLTAVFSTFSCIASSNLYFLSPAPPLLFTDIASKQQWFRAWDRDELTLQQWCSKGQPLWRGSCYPRNHLVAWFFWMLSALTTSETCYTKPFSCSLKE